MWTPVQFHRKEVIAMGKKVNVLGKPEDVKKLLRPDSKLYGKPRKMKSSKKLRGIL